MAGPNRIDSTPVRMSTNVTVARQTPHTEFGHRVSAGLNTAAGVVAQGAALAAPLVPGGSIVSAAVSSLTGMAGGVTSQYSAGNTMAAPGGSLGAGPSIGGQVSTVGGGGSVGAMAGIGNTHNATGNDANVLRESMDMNRELINLQIAMQRENQVFTTVSNVLKMRHDSVKNSIQNVR